MYSITAQSSQIQENEKIFIEMGTKYRSDKVSTHKYQLMYSMFLMPAVKYHKEQISSTNNRKFKLFEIGIGCDVPGASLFLWQSIFGTEYVDLWMGDYAQNCIDKFNNANPGHSFHIIHGDQSNPKSIREWIQQSQGQFDVIIVMVLILIHIFSQHLTYYFMRLYYLVVYILLKIYMLVQSKDIIIIIWKVLHQYCKTG